MKPIPGSGKHSGKRLLNEILLLTMLIPALSILVVAVVSQMMVSTIMRTDLERRALITVDEVSAFLEEPLYTLDDAQAIRICEALLSSGRISGIILDSVATGRLVTSLQIEGREGIPSITREISRGEMMLGKVVITFSDAEMTAMRYRLSMITGSIITVVVIAGSLGNRFLLKAIIKPPLAVVIAGIEAIAAGNYNNPMRSTRYHEVNILGETINTMAGNIQTARKELTDANIQLEKRVMERTAELQSSLSDLKLAQKKLVESEKLSTLGYIAASMTHELNTPLGAIVSSNRTIIDFIESQLLESISFSATFSEAQRGLLERVASLGFSICQNLKVANLSNENRMRINAELEAHGYTDAADVADLVIELDLMDHFDELTPILEDQKGREILAQASRMVSIRRMAEIVDVSTEKAANVVRSLRSYLEPNTTREFQSVDVVQDIETALAIIPLQMKKNVYIIRKFIDVRASGFSDELSRVWMNLIRNALQAMEFHGTLTIVVEKIGRQVQVSFEDTGSGIPQELQHRVFEPFFTTKEQGEGMGLGLDICRRIVEGCGGSISFESIPGKTRFIVKLPEYGA